MDQTALDELKFCSFCPNICRFYYPTTGLSQKESLAPSALAYVGHAVVNNFLDYNQEVHQLLLDIEGFHKCKEACVYNYNIPAHLEKVIQEYEPKLA
jgi:hypothetical protein